MSSSLPAAPASQVAAQPIPAATLNSYRDNLNFLLNPPRWRLRQVAGAGQTLAIATYTSITMDVEDKDTDGVHTGTNAIVTIVTPGVYLIDWLVSMTNVNGATYRTRLLQNGVAVPASQPVFNQGATGASAGLGHVMTLPLAAGDTLAIQGYCSSAAATEQNVDGRGSRFDGTWISNL